MISYACTKKRDGIVACVFRIVVNSLAVVIRARPWGSAFARCRGNSASTATHREREPFPRRADAPNRQILPTARAQNLPVPVGSQPQRHHREVFRAGVNRAKSQITDRVARRSATGPACPAVGGPAFPARRLHVAIPVRVAAKGEPCYRACSNRARFRSSRR